MATIRLTTCDRWPDLFESDLQIAGALQALGHDVRPARWQGDFAMFQQADLTVLRAHWDYHHEMAAFTAWLDRLAAEAVSVYNPVELVRWNLHKRYLLDLQTQGVRVPVTDVLGAEDDLSEIYARHKWAQAVIKPMTGASGHLVERVSRDALAGWQAQVHSQRADGEWLVQEFMPHIEAGELSLVYIDGEFSHAFLKQPQPGEFRINSQYQGQIRRATPPDPVLAQAKSILRTLPTVPLYARVDGVVLDGDQFCLIELELNEPGLGYQYAPEQAQRFAQAIVNKLKGQNQ